MNNPVATRRSNEFLKSTLLFEGSIFHYTSSPGFLGAMSSNKLWATEAFGLNDVSELRHGWAFIQTWLRDQPQDDVRDDMLTEIPVDANNNLASDTFILCGSQVDDDASQWRLYADGARGYCIELDSSIALQVCSKRPPADRPVGARAIGWRVQDFASVNPWLRVLYTDAEKEDALRHFHDKARIALEEAESHRLESEAFESLYMSYLDELSDGLITLAQCMKSSAFSGEAEVRCVVTMPAEAIDKHCAFRATPYGVVRYVELAGTDSVWGSNLDIAASPRGNLPVKSVRLGPGQVTQNSRDAAKALLRRHGHAQDVAESAATVR